MRSIRGSNQVPRREASIELVVRQISVQNDQPSIVHEMLIFFRHQFSYLIRQLTRKHNARWFGGLPTRARPYQVVDALAMILHPDRHDELSCAGKLSIAQALERVGSDGSSIGSAMKRALFPALPPTSLTTQSNATGSI